MAVHKLDNYLRTYRKRSGFSQDELAYLLRTGDGTKISRYERGIRTPSLETAFAFEAVFGIPIRQLFAGRFQKVERSVATRARFLSRRLASQPRTPRLDRKLETLAARGGRPHRAVA